MRGTPPWNTSVPWQSVDSINKHRSVDAFCLAASSPVRYVGVLLRLYSRHYFKFLLWFRPGDFFFFFRKHKSWCNVKEYCKALTPVTWTRSALDRYSLVFTLSNNTKVAMHSKLKLPKMAVIRVSTAVSLWFLKSVLNNWRVRSCW